MKNRALLTTLLSAVVLSACAPGAPAPTPETALTRPAATAFVLTSPDLPADGRLPVEYTCDGGGATLPLTWSGAPAGTRSFAVIMHHVAGQEDIHWYWVLYDIPAAVTSLPKNGGSAGTLGNNINNGQAEYSPPCSAGPGDKTYTYTVYALSAEPQLSVPASQVSRAVLLDAMKNITLASAELSVVYARQSTGEAAQETQQQGGGGAPPAEAVAACAGSAEQAACEFTWSKGPESGVCESVQGQLACSPKGDSNRGGNQQGGAQAASRAAGQDAYNIEQAISDKAQGMTVAFDALAFMTGDLGSASFFPPGKVADFWGFQYLRDNDPSQMGHAGEFLTSAAMNMLNILSVDQRGQLVALAQGQVSSINEYGYRRFVLIQAFQRLRTGELPAGTTGLSEDAVKAYSAQLYELDGEISYARAQLMGNLLSSMDATQKASLDAMVGKGMLEWPKVDEPEDIRGLDRDVKVAVMTYAADMFSWYAGSVDADVYFCPERHGTYFGSFYLKDARAMLDPTYAIPTDMTGNMGGALLAALTPEQSRLITGLVDVQEPALLGIVETRKAVSTELRKFLSGSSTDKATVLALMRHYGELDGEIIYNYAVSFASVRSSLSSDQQAALMALRQQMLGDMMYPSGAYLYSQSIPMPSLPDTDFLFQ